jgi:hypothetical protein
MPIPIKNTNSPLSVIFKYTMLESKILAPAADAVWLKAVR